jgi:dTMP kinase
VTRGHFVTFEGGEGAGKTTQIRRLAERLSATGIDVVATREPGGSENAEAIRALLVSGDPGRWDQTTEALLMLAARSDHWRRKIDPALERGAWVLCDRFHDSTIAYQGYGRGVPLADLAALRRIALGDAGPDLTIILDLPVAEGLARAKSRLAGQAGAEDRFERMDLAFHERLRSGFHAIAAADPGRCVLIDAGPSADEVQQAVAAALSVRLGLSL